MARVGPKSGQEGGQMGTKTGQGGAREAQGGPKMARDGPKAAPKGGVKGPSRHPVRGQEGARETQERPKKKRDPKKTSFWDHFGVYFGDPVGPPAVIRGCLEALFFGILFLILLGAGRNLKKWISAHTSFKNRRVDVSKNIEKRLQNWDPTSQGKEFGTAIWRDKNRTPKRTQN